MIRKDTWSGRKNPNVGMNRRQRASSPCRQQRELPLIILLLSPANMVLSSLILNYNEPDMAQHSGAVTLFLVLIIVGANVLVRLLTGDGGLQGLRHTCGGANGCG